MVQTLPPGNVEAQIQGEISGQVAVGNYNIQIGAIHGGVVNVAAPEQQPRPQPRPTPVFLRPRPFPGLLDREKEVNAASTALQSATPVEFHGQAGLGKTTLLRHLSHHPAATSFPDGVIYLSARHQPIDDLLQSLFDAFYESDVPFKPTDAQVRHALQGKQALILLDDVELARDEVETLIDSAPGCTFLLASPERRLWGEGRAMTLRGLPLDDALALVEKELGRPLTPDERPAAQALCTALECHPLHLLQAAAMVREEGRSLAEVARRTTQTPSPAEALTAETLNALPKPERQVLAALAALSGAPLHADHLAALTGLADPAPVLEALQRRGLVQAHSPRYSLAGTLGDDLQQMWDLTPWAERALAYFTAWAERHRSAPDRLLEEADAILQTLKWAAEAGRWKEVLHLGRAVEGALALGRRWGAWAQVLQWVLQAARALADQAAEAWALHQLGSRALCLGRAEEARTSLSQALRMREAIGDRAGAAVTRHNLNLLPGAPPAPPRKPPAPKAGPSPAAWSVLAAGIVIAASLLIGIVIFIITPTPAPPPPPPANTPTSTPILTNTPTKTPTPMTLPPPHTLTRTPTPSRTPTVHPCAPGVLYCEDFEDGRADGWDLRSGWAVERDGANYVLSGGGHNWSTLVGYTWDDYRVRFRLKLLQGGIHLNYRLTEGPTRYFIGFHQDGLYLSRQQRDTFTDLATVEAPHRLDRWHQVEIVGWGGHLQVYVDGNLEMDYTDSSPLQRGTIAFETLDDSHAQVDDIEVMGSGPESRHWTPTPTVHPCAPGVLYCEDFEDGQAQGWQFYDADGRPIEAWPIEAKDGNHFLVGTGHRWATLTDREWDDYRVLFRLKLLQGGIHLNYRLTEASRYFIGFHQGGLYLYRQGRELATVEASHQMDRWYEVEIVGWGGHLQIYVDGNLEMDYTDSSPLQRGTIAFETLDDSQAQVDDIEVMGSGPESTRWTPTPTWTPTRTPTPSISFWADPNPVQAGFCTTIHWETASVQAVFFDGRGVAGVDTHQTCPCSPESHTLDVLLRDDTHEIRTLTINVTGSCVTPDTKGPDISGLKASEESLDNHCIYCSPPCEMDVYVNVVDPSGVAAVKLIYRKPGETTWIPSGMTNVGEASYKTTVNANGWNSGTLEFYVQARDNHGNVSESGHLTMEVQYCLY